MHVPAGPFMGVPESELRAIGCVTVAAARLEWTIRTVSADLYRNPAKRQANEVLREIRRAVADGLPAHARIEAAEIADWSMRAGEALQERHVASHSAAVRRGADPVMMHLRSGNIQPMEADGLMEVAKRIADVDREGGRLMLALRQSPRPGVFLPNVVVDEKWIPLCSTDEGGADLARPTDQELDQWWNERGPFPRLS